MNPKIKNALEWTYCILIAVVIALFHWNTNSCKTNINE